MGAQPFLVSNSYGKPTIAIVSNDKLQAFIKPTISGIRTRTAAVQQLAAHLVKRIPVSSNRRIINANEKQRRFDRFQTLRVVHRIYIRTLY